MEQSNEHPLERAALDVTEPNEALDARELLVLQLLACGYTVEQIAALLDTGREQVAHAAERATTKLHASGVPAAVQLAVARGLIVRRGRSRSHHGDPAEKS